VSELPLKPQQARNLLRTYLAKDKRGWHTDVIGPVEQWCYENGIDVPRVIDHAILQGYSMEIRFSLEFKNPDSALAFKMRWL
jgi:hypothetical protein